ncbi:MAG: glycosyltransferase [Flavobacteriales bacterium]|jgi:glycosyltransferase involved in cell wall biosynthesis|nr:glycosyltransferase [Flavobacteriales bacterium]TXI82893.1 MAG: glycosyltransferase [Flavobacteriales bacterium]
MKVSLITVCRNAAPVIAGSVESVLAQTHPDIEYIIIDGASTDGTRQLLEGYRHAIAHFVSEPDQGIYDAMNKGLRAATGEVIGFVNAGDLLMTPETIAHVVDAFQRSHAEAVYGDIIMVDEHDIHKVHRTWLSGTYHRENFRRGWMPPHVGTFIRKSAYDRYGHFNTDLRIGADYEILLRFLYRHRIATVHLREVLVRFRLGGMSNGSLRHILKANREVRASWGINGLTAPPLLVTRKLWSKVLQFFH